MKLISIFCSLVIASVIGQQPPILPDALRIGESYIIAIHNLYIFKLR